MYELVIQEYIGVINTNTDEEVLHIEMDADMGEIISEVEKLVNLLNRR